MKNGLVSVLIHGMVLTGCCAYCAAFQSGLGPYFSPGDSAITLTSLSIGRQGSANASFPAKSPPRNENPVVLAEDKAEQEQITAEEADIADDIPDAMNEFKNNRETIISSEEMEKNDDRHAGENQPGSDNADNLSKGVAAGLAAPSQVHPHYPLGSRLRGEEGTVRIEAVVGRSGRALRFTVIESSGFPALDEAALDAVKRARFGSAGGLPPAKETKTTLKFRFDLTD